MRYLRKLDNKLWLDKEISHSEVDGSIQADALKNFKTTANKLSIFRIDDVHRQLVRVLVAIAAGGDKVDHCDYVLFDIGIITELGIKLAEIPGDTLDEEINQLHLDLVRLSGEQVLALAQRLQESGEIGRIGPKEMGKAIAEGVKQGNIEKGKLRPKMLDRLKEYIQH